MDDIVERIKDANRIEDVIDETGGFGLQRRYGRYLKCVEHDSLVVDTHEQCYFWNSKQEGGDVIEWVEKRYNWDFRAAVEFLARRAKLPEPDWGHQDQAVRLATRAKEDALTVAARWFVRQLRNSEGATAYARSRGWTDETIRLAGLGYSGEGTAAERKDLGGEFAMHGVDPASGAYKAVMGIPSGMLVYPHVRGGRVRYLSCRGVGEKRHYNLPQELVGARQMFHNHVYGGNEEVCVLVEGQADAITLGQWGIAAVAMAGTAHQDHLSELENLRKHHDQLYLGMDGDEGGAKTVVGRNNEWPLAETLGPMCRILAWPGEVKDANDWLKAMNEEGVEGEEQRKRVQAALDTAAPMAVAAARWAGGLKGAQQDKGVKRAVAIIAQMDKVLLAHYRQRLADGLGTGIREFNNLIREAKGEKAGPEDGGPAEIVETLGGFIGGYLVEYVYDAEEEKALLAYRGPNGEIDTAPHLDIEGVRYIPRVPNSLVTGGGVLFASKLGGMKSTRELVTIVEAFINQHYLLDDRFFGRLAAYYVLLTWLYDCFNALPYLRAMGDYGSGKSELMRRIGHVCYRMMTTGGAGTAASLFRALHAYRGTAFMDEMDLSDGGDMANETIKILNLGAMKGNPVWRLDEHVRADGTRDYEIEAYNVYGPKLIAMRKDFRDQAVSSRCLTVRLMGKEAIELKNRGIKLHLDDEFYKQAQGIRNLLLRWRLEKWKPEIEVGEDLMDLAVPARLNQVTMPLKAIAQDDPELMRDITVFVRSLNEELILERSMGLDARVMDALVAILEDEKYKSFLLEGEMNGHGVCKFVYTKHVSKIANDLIEEMNVDETEEKGEGGDGEGGGRKKWRGVTSHTVGKIARNTLQLEAKRRNNGYVIIYDDERMAALRVKYGIAKVKE